MFQQIMNYVSHNFTLAMLILVFLLALISTSNFKKILCPLLLFFPIGIVEIREFIIHGFYIDSYTKNIYWKIIIDSNEFYLALCYLALGITSIIACVSPRPYKIAVALTTTILFWGMVIQDIFMPSYSNNSTNITLLTNITIPLLLWISIVILPDKRKNSYIHPYIL